MSLIKIITVATHNDGYYKILQEIENDYSINCIYNS